MFGKNVCTDDCGWPAAKEEEMQVCPDSVGASIVFTCYAGSDQSPAGSGQPDAHKVSIEHPVSVIGSTQREGVLWAGHVGICRAICL